MPWGECIHRQAYRHRRDRADSGTRGEGPIRRHLALPAPAGAICTDQNDAQCAIVAKNHFEPDCEIASLHDADNGPIALKNNGDACGSVIAAGIQMKNNLQWTYDPTIERTLGFCPPDQCPKTWERVLWEEIRAG